MSLDPREEQFCQHYLVEPIAARAARRSGYPEANARQRAWELLQRDDIQERIGVLSDERAREVKINAADVLRELMLIANANPKHAFDEHQNLLPINEIPDEVAKRIASWEVEHNPITGTQITKVKFWDKPRALEMLARHLALFRDTLVLKDGKLDTSEENLLAARVAAILEMWRKREREVEGLL
jgi:phage terminase small subunit